MTLHDPPPGHLGPTNRYDPERIREQRVQRVLEYMFDEDGLALGSQGEFETFNGIAGETDDLVVVGNWNDKTRRDPFYGPIQRKVEWKREWYATRSRCWYAEEYDAHLSGTTILVDTTPSRLLKVLESLDVRTDWSDGFLYCDCGKGFRTEPDGFGFELYGWVGDGDYMCGDCLREHNCDTCGNPNLDLNCDAAPNDHCHCGHGCEHNEKTPDPTLWADSVTIKCERQVDWRCPYCKDTLLQPEAALCDACGTPHHGECLEESGCATAGCSNATNTYPEP